MVQINFTNAKVRDDGFGLSVNEHKLENIISVVLGVFPDIKTAESTAWISEKDVKPFRPPYCNISITIDPIYPQTESTICFGDNEQDKPLEDILEGSHGDNEKTETADTEE